MPPSGHSQTPVLSPWRDSFDSFSEAAAAVLRFLNERIGMGLWMVTRVREDDWIVLHAVGRGYDVCDGKVMRWSDSYCSRMVRGAGPRIAADARKVPAYCQAPINRKLPMPIAAYVGVPLMNEGGTVFGTLCAVSPTVQPKTIELEQPLVELMGGLLSTILSRELHVQAAQRKAEVAHAESLSDSLTGLLNRRGLDEIAAREESRCERYGHNACVFSIDVNGLKQVNDEQGHRAGDRLIVRIAKALKAAARKSDVVARVGGDEFLILAPECSKMAGMNLLGRIQRELRRRGLSAAVGLASRQDAGGILAAMEAADAAMYACKRQSAHRRAMRRSA